MILVNACWFNNFEFNPTGGNQIGVRVDGTDNRLNFNFTFTLQSPMIMIIHYKQIKS